MHLRPRLGRTLCSGAANISPKARSFKHCRFLSDDFVCLSQRAHTIVEDRSRPATVDRINSVIWIIGGEIWPRMEGDCVTGGSLARTRRCRVHTVCEPLERACPITLVVLSLRICVKKPQPLVGELHFASHCCSCQIHCCAISSRSEKSTMPLRSKSSTSSRSCIIQVCASHPKSNSPTKPS